jgi:hypothetical protein
MNNKEKDDFINGIIKQFDDFIKKIKEEEIKEEEIKEENEKDFDDFEIEYNYYRIAKQWNERLKLFHIAKYLNDGWMPDWNDYDQKKYFIYYNFKEKYFLFTYTYNCKNAIDYFKDRKTVQKALKMMGEESLKDLFMIED